MYFLDIFSMQGVETGPAARASRNGDIMDKTADAESGTHETCGKVWMVQNCVQDADREEEEIESNEKFHQGNPLRHRNSVWIDHRACRVSRTRLVTPGRRSTAGEELF